jgi:colicin import membrane protein
VSVLLACVKIIEEQLRQRATEEQLRSVGFTPRDEREAEAEAKANAKAKAEAKAKIEAEAEAKAAARGGA